MPKAEERLTSQQRAALDADALEEIKRLESKLAKYVARWKTLTVRLEDQDAGRHRGIVVVVQAVVDIYLGGG